MVAANGGHWTRRSTPRAWLTTIWAHSVERSTVGWLSDQSFVLKQRPSVYQPAQIENGYGS